MLVADIMTQDIVAVAPETSIETAAKLFAERSISGAPVVTADHRPVGVVSLADLTHPERPRSSRDGYPLFYEIGPQNRCEQCDDIDVGPGRVADVMSPFVLSIESCASLAEAGSRLVAEGVHRLLVMDRQELVGIVSSLDVLRGMVRQAH